MGTNYYVEMDKCEKCGHQEKGLHIGKSSSGWQFAFQENERYSLNSWKQWRKFLRDRTIVDEYGENVDLDELEKIVETRCPGDKNHTTYCSKLYPEYANDHCYLDNEGYSFTKGDFS